MNSYVLKDLIESIEYSISELKEYINELKDSDDKYDQEVADDITKALKNINIKSLNDLKNSI